jgi:hypothetical protein
VEKGNGSKRNPPNRSHLGFEATLWATADKLRGNLVAAEFKHVVLVLIFLKYISDAFEERHAALLSGELCVPTGSQAFSCLKTIPYPLKHSSKSLSNFPTPTDGEFEIYQTEDGRTRIEVHFVGETVWLSLNQMADLFQRDKSVIPRHIKNIFEEGELRSESVVAKFAAIAADGKTYQVEFYNLDVIISVGYRVKSHRGCAFLQVTLLERVSELFRTGCPRAVKWARGPPARFGVPDQQNWTQLFRALTCVGGVDKLQRLSTLRKFRKECSISLKSC